MHPFVWNHTDQPRNPNYEKDIVYVTKHVKWILNSIGIWPVMLKTIGECLPKIAIVLSNLVVFFIQGLYVLHIILEQQDNFLRLRLLAFAWYSLISLMKFWALTMRKPNIKYCVEEMYADWKQVELQRDRTLMLKYGKIGRDLTIYSAVFMYSASMSYVAVMQYAVGSHVDENNRTIRVLVYPAYSGLFDVQKTPIYETVYILQCMCTFVLNTVSSGTCGLAALFATHACGQIDVIMSQLNDLVDEKFTFKKNYDPDTRLMEIVQHHMKILKFSAIIETVLQEVCFFEFVGSTFVICLLEYYCITDWQQNNKFSLITYSMLLSSLTFNMFLLCYIGDLLIEKSANVGISCCMINWYRLPIKTSQGLILIIAMSNNPLKISAGRIIYLSLSTFGSVLKTSFAYLNFVRSTVIY
ncbi:odorant receptor 4-like [Frieseomelitta varia]|uniref:odorant receptor 4-like n=1 Tax=Frieseomelitta varia TaxID=561572 RepID=UPI001CB6B08B|nr:odorant receptor 4-like [Frieseomelitta varia]